MRNPRPYEPTSFSTFGITTAPPRDYFIAGRYVMKLEASAKEDFNPFSLIIDQAHRLFEEHATPERLRDLLDVAGAFDARLWGAVADLGLPAAPIAERFGGFGLGWPMLFELAELAGRYTAAIPIIPAAVAASALGDLTPVDSLRVAEGRGIAALGFEWSDEEAQPPLELIAGRVHGTLPAVAFGAVADLLLTAAWKDGAVSLVWIDLARENVSRQPLNAIDNGRAFANITFVGAEAAVIGGEEELEYARLLAALATAFEQLGGAQKCLEMSCNYARERSVFGQPIGAFQAIKHKLADIYCAIELARGCAFAASEKLQAEAPMRREVAAARIMATRAYEIAASETIQVFGAVGVTWEAAPHHHYRRSRALALEAGAPAQWREILVRDLVGVSGEQVA